MNNNKAIALLQFLLKGKEEVQSNKEMDEFLQLCKKEKCDKPLILLGKGNCGIVSGILEVEKSIQSYLEERGKTAEVLPVGCIGACKYEPLVSIQLPGKTRLTFNNVRPENVSTILDGVFNHDIPLEFVFGQHRSNHLLSWKGINYIDELDFFKKQKRLILRNAGIINPEDIFEYIANDGYQAFVKCLQTCTFEEALQTIEKSKLRGRGGGGFSTFEKLNIAYNTPHEERFLICNAEESDPGVYKDRAIIEADPHKVLEGIALASYCIGVNKAYINIRADYSLAIERLNKAIKEAHDCGILGQNILDSGYNLEIIIKKNAGAFVSGEETALINSIEGKRAMPRPKPPYPAQSGLWGKPTVINNVETLANLPMIFLQGPSWYNSIGTNNSKGTKVFSVSGSIQNNGLVEVEMGTSLNTIVQDIAGGLAENKRLKAVHMGGPSGYLIKDTMLDMEIDFDKLLESGITLCHGGITVIDDQQCIIDLIKYFMKYMQEQSCGKCIPCREGTRRIYEILEQISVKPVDNQNHSTLERFKGVLQLEGIAEVMQQTSLCGLGQRAANPVISGLKMFRNEFEEHIFDRKCNSNICKGLKEYYILVDKCTGCAACAKKCPADAIIGTERQPFFIVQEKCISCGKCFETCKFNAIIIR